MGLIPFLSPISIVQQFRMWNRLSVGRSLIARSTRRYTKPSGVTGRSWVNAYWQTGAHGPELYVLTAYCMACTSFLLYNIFGSHAQRNEWTWFPFMNKDMHYMYNLRTNWEDPRSQRNFCTTDPSPKFFNEAAWKNDLKELLNEIYE